MAYYCCHIKKICAAVFDVSYISINFSLNIVFSVDYFYEFAIGNIIKNSFYKLSNWETRLLPYCAIAVHFEFINNANFNDICDSISCNNGLFGILQLHTMGFGYY